MARDKIEDFWDDGRIHEHWVEDGKDYWTDEEMSEHEYLYGEPDPDDTGEYYTDWMPEFSGSGH